MFLSIAIPTFKRPKLLHKALMNILPQIRDRSDVQVVVTDDSDGLDNGPWVRKALDSFPNARLRYLVNPKNLGIDENIKKCIDSSDSEYVWLLGEDDLLTAGAVAKVAEALAIHQPVFLFANYIYCDDSHTRVAARAVLPEIPGVAVIRFDEFAADTIWALGFIGGCVIRTADWRGRDVSRYAGSYYSHVGGIIDMALGKNICVIGDILVLNRAENADTFTWSSSTFDVYYSFYRVLELSRLAEKPDLLSKCRRAAAKLFSVNSLPWLAAKRADGVFDLSTYLKYYTVESGANVVWRFAAYLIAVFPRGPLVMLRRAQLRHRFSRNGI